MWWGNFCIGLSNFLPSFVVLGSTFVQNTTFFLILSYRSISVGFSLVDCVPCIIMGMCPVVLFVDFSRCLLISFSVRPVQVFSKPFFIALTRIASVGLKSDALRYCASYGLIFWSRMLFVTASDCCVSRGIYHIPVFLLLVPLIIIISMFLDCHIFLV